MILSTGWLSTSLWVLALMALLAYAAPAVLQRLSNHAVSTSLLLAWVSHGLLLGLVLFFSGRFGFGPAISVMAWLVLTVYAIESRLYPQLQSRRVLAGLGALAVLIGLVFPGTALSAKTSIWLPLHGALGIAAYGLLAVATVHAWLMRGAEAQMRAAPGSQAQVGLPLMTLERLMFAFVLASFILLSATLLAGWLFAEDLYGAGSALRWDHKTIFSVLAWGLMALLLLARWQWGWRGKRAARYVYGCATLLLLAYVGSRFVLEVLLKRGA
jgi:ABC-type uncharacterized transport system permease subunit